MVAYAAILNLGSNLNNRIVSGPPALAAERETVYQFHEFELDVARRELRKRGIRLRVTPQTVRLLGYLLEHGGKLVTRERLAEFLWPGQSTVELEGNLNAAVRDAREALGDTARDCRFIRTEPRQGYTFIHPFSSNQEEEVAEVVATPVLVTPAESGRSKTILYWGMGITALLALALLAHAWFEKPIEHGIEASVVQLTNFIGNVGNATFSPDGKRLAFEWDRSEGYRTGIYVREVNGTELTRMDDGNGDANGPAWSPDGQQVAFVETQESGPPEIRVVPAAGGAEKTVSVIPNQSRLAWTADGRWIAYEVIFVDESVTALRDCGIWAVSVAGGEKRHLTNMNETTVGDLSPAFSPDGRWLAFFRSESSGVQDAYLQAVHNGIDPKGKPERLTEERQNSRDLTWTPDSQALIYSSRRDGSSTLYRLSIRPGQRNLTHLGGDNAFEPVVNPKTNDIVYTHRTTTDRIRRVSLEPKAAGQPDTTFPIKQARNPALSPDGKTLAFEYADRGQIGIWVVKTDGSGLRRLVDMPSTLTGSPRWSPDGTKIAFDSRVGGRSKIHVASADGSSPHAITTGNADDILPSWSLDGQHVYFTSDRSGDYQIWRTNLTGAPPEQISTKGGFRPLESADGHQLFYTKGAMNTSIWAGEVSRIGSGFSDSESRIAPFLSYWPNFTTTGNHLFFTPRQTQSHMAVVDLNLSTGKQRQLPVSTERGLHGMAVGSDANSLYASVRESVESNLMLLQFR
jgi:Tol biopolymer transport system component/DNA-binding winged helix-turn-helix (wHTH) protein